MTNLVRLCRPDSNAVEGPIELHRDPVTMKATVRPRSSVLREIQTSLGHAIDHHPIATAKQKQ